MIPLKLAYEQILKIAPPDWWANWALCQTPVSHSQLKVIGRPKLQQKVQVNVVIAIRIFYDFNK